MASKLYDYTKEELQNLLDESNSYSDLLKRINLNPRGGNQRTLKKIIVEYNLDETKLNENRHNLYVRCAKNTDGSRKTYSLEDILDGKHPNYQSSKLLKRLIESELKERKCEKCGITEWMGEDISFHLHHKDGNHNNNKFENLEILCPNCHSQTDNFSGKSSKKNVLKKEKNQKIAKYGISEDGQRFYDGCGSYKILCPICEEKFISRSAEMCGECRKKERRKPKVTKEELFKIMENNSYHSAAKILNVDRKTVARWHKYYTNKERENGNVIIGSDKAPTREELKGKIRLMSFLQVGKEYGVSDNAVRRWCDTYGLPRHMNKIKSIPEEEWVNI